MRIFASAALTLWAGMALPVSGQDTGVVRLPGPPPLAMPGWLAPAAQARDRADKSTPAEALSSYLAPSLPPAVVAHYEAQLRAARISFETKPEDNGAAIEATAGRYLGTVRIQPVEGGARVEVRYALKPDPPPAPPASAGGRDMPPLALEWPAWLAIPGGRLISERTNPPGRITPVSVDVCPGDVLGKPSQGCLLKVFESSSPLEDLYQYFDDLLSRNGFNAPEAAPGTPATPADLGKWLAPPFASLKVRAYPAPGAESYYSQLNIFLRQPQTPDTKVDIAFLVRNPPRAEAAPGAPRNVSGLWTFTHVGGRFTGTISLQQSGASVTGGWHTATGKSEADSPVAGRVDGSTVYLTRILGNLKQEYVLRVSSDGERIEGYGDGWGISHGDLNMRRVGQLRPQPTAQAQPPADNPRAWYEATPRPGEAWTWQLQSVKVRGAPGKYNTMYYEKATDRTVETPLALPAGGVIVHVFPVDCSFFIQDENGKQIKFSNAQEARGKTVGPGKWMVYPVNVGGVTVFMR